MPDVIQSRFNPPPEDRPRPLLEHLDELRTCVIRCLAAWGVCTLVMIPLCPYLVRWLQDPLRRVGQDPAALVRVFAVEAGVDFVIRAMLWGGTILSLPLLLFFISRFVFPGLRQRERRWIGGVLIAAGILLVAGVVAGYRYVLPMGLHALMAINHWLGVGLGPLQLESYTKIVFQTVLAFGLAFELPLLLLVLGWIGVLPSRFLRDKRRHAAVAIAFLSMMLTPPDMVSMVAMMIPMYLLYEICIGLIRVRELAKRSD